MDWLTQQLVDVVKGIAIGIPSFLLGLWIYTRFIAAKQASDIAVGTADAILKHPKMQPALKKLEKYEKELEPLIEKAKTLNLQELVDLAKSIRVTVETLNKQTPPPPPPKRKKK